MFLQELNFVPVPLSCTQRVKEEVRYLFQQLGIYSAGPLPPWVILKSFQFVFSRSDYNYLGGKPSFNLSKNLSSTKKILLMLEMRKLVIKEMGFLDVVMSTGPLLASEKPLLWVEGVQNLVLFILGIAFPKYLENLVVTRQIV